MVSVLSVISRTNTEEVDGVKVLTKLWFGYQISEKINGECFGR